MPIRMLIARLQQHRSDNGRQLDQSGSESEAQSNALTNAINVVGIPIKNTVSGTHTASSSGGHTGSIKEQFSIGNLGIVAGINSEQVGTGFGVNRKPGEVGLHLGALNFGLSNQAADIKNTQTQTIASSSATGAGATSTSQTDTHSNSYAIGGAVNVQNTISSSHAHSSSLTGSTSAVADATGSAIQNTQVPNNEPLNLIHIKIPDHGNQQPNPQQPNPGQPNPQQPNLQQAFVEMKVVEVPIGPQQGFEQYPQPGFPRRGYQTPGIVESCAIRIVYI